MKFRFALLELFCDRTADDAEITRRISALKSAFRTQSEPAESFSIDVQSELPEQIHKAQFIFICGTCEPKELVKRCSQLDELGISAMLVLDAFYYPQTLGEAFSALEQANVHLTKTAGAISTLKSNDCFIYAHAKPDCTATACLLFDEGTSTLVIERNHAPYKGENAFPGGFLRVMLESIEDCAVRELEEECSIKILPSELVLIDIRSGPERDPRAHVIDTGFAALISAERKRELVAQLKAADDAASAQLMPVSELLASGMAFDHTELLHKALEKFAISVQS